MHEGLTKYKREFKCVRKHEIKGSLQNRSHENKQHTCIMHLNTPHTRRQTYCIFGRVVHFHSDASHHVQQHFVLIFPLFLAVYVNSIAFRSNTLIPSKLLHLPPIKHIDFHSYTTLVNEKSLTIAERIRECG